MQPTIKIVQGHTEEEIWHQLSEDFKDEEPFLDYYEVAIQQLDTAIHLSIEQDLGGGFEGGYEATSFVSQIELTTPFSFHVERESMLVEIGKLLGLEDIEIGYPEFDEKVRIKTNDAVRIKKIFQDVEPRKAIQSLISFDLTLEAKEEKALLYTFELQMEEAIVDPSRLRELYSAFYSLIQAIRNS